MMVKIILADDHNIIRQGISTMLNNENDMAVVATADNGRDAVKLVKKHKPDVVVMDISMPDLNGIEASKMIKDALPDTKIIALSVHTGRRFVTGMLKAGVSGYLIKQCALEELVGAIHCVMKNQSYLSPEITEVVMKDYVNGSLNTDASVELSGREREVLQLVAEGMKSDDIASRLNISIKTVSSHRSQVMKKLGIDSIAELAIYAVREGVIVVD